MEEISTKIQNEPAENSAHLKSRKNIIIILICMGVLGAIGASQYYQERHASSEQKKTQTNEQTVSTDGNNKPPSSTDELQQQLIPVEFDFDIVSEENLEAAITSLPNETNLPSSPISPPASDQTQKINMKYLFSAYKNTAVITEQTNINQFIIGGLDDQGKKYALFSYFTPADMVSAALFSHDGKKVAFQEHDGVYIYDFISREKIKITDFEAFAYGGWNNDGKHLAILKKIGNSKQWYLYDVNTGTLDVVPFTIENDSSRFGWMNQGKGYSFSILTAGNVYLSKNGENPTMIDLQCNDGLMFSETDQYLTCSSMWLGVYDVSASRATHINGQDEDGNFFYNPVWIYNGKNSNDPMMLIHKENDTYITTLNNFFFSKVRTVKKIKFSPEQIKPIMHPGVIYWNIRYINNDEAISVGTKDNNSEFLILVSGFQSISIENPKLQFSYLSADKGFFNHGFSVGSVEIER